MKKISFFCLMLICSIQLLNAQTTWDEYNYCIAGYKDVLTKGHDPKAGYTMSEAVSNKYSFGNETTTVWVRKLVKNETKKVVAYLLIYQLRDKTNEQSYYCIPHPNSSIDIINKFHEDINWVNAIEANSIYKLRSILFAIAAAVKW